MRKRSSGILLHLTSLPSMYGIGDMGPMAYRFADFLAQTGQGIWQILPLNPTDAVGGYSPYHSASAFAGNPLLISPDLLMEEGLLTQPELDNTPHFPDHKVDFENVEPFKMGLLKRAYERFKETAPPFEYRAFCRDHADWLDDFAAFDALRDHYQGMPWDQWPVPVRDRYPDALREVCHSLADAMENRKFYQYLFQKQWNGLRRYCNGKGVQFLGDIPIYVNPDSADVWAHPNLFKLDESRKPYAVSGVPPDYFSSTGQLWGHPVYRWDVLQQSGYKWWRDRMTRNLELFDRVRVDHFRGFVAFWEVPATETTAINGKWVEAPALDFFNGLSRRFSCLPIIAEDLGTITPDVREVMARFNFPGMRLLLFSFGDDLPTNLYAPHNHIRNCVIYTGTHDNNTARGWFENEAGDGDRERLFAYLGRWVSSVEAADALVRLAMMSVADLAILPIQDLLGLGGDARMNRPSVAKGNWGWRLKGNWLTEHLSEHLAGMTRIYGRS